MRKSRFQITIIALMCCFAFLACETTKQMMTPVIPMTEETPEPTVEEPDMQQMEQTTEVIPDEPELPTIEELPDPLVEEYEPQPVEEITETP